MAIANLVIVATAFTLVAAHFNLKDPAPYNPIDCNRPDCAGPCPPIWSQGVAKARYSPRNPARVWRRGQNVNIEWHRNNHEGGFYTRSLVPVQHIHNRAWHRKSVFEHGCWVQNRYYCGKRPACGTDKNGFAYRNKMRVPTIFPDGDYVFAMTWYGGLHWQRRKAHFSDYYTCAFVRIQGGPRTNRHYPSFVAGRNHRSDVPRGKCVSTSHFLGECAGEECKNNKVFVGRPRAFRNGRRPPPLYRSAYAQGARNSRGTKIKPASLASEKRALEEVKKERLRDEQMAKEQERARLRNEARKKAQRNARRKRQQRQRQSAWQQRRTHRKPYRSGPFLCSTGNIPKGPTGPWGPRYSNLWWKKRHQWWQRRNYCVFCKNEC